jgi:hypothetical protein
VMSKDTEILQLLPQRGVLRIDPRSKNQSAENVISKLDLVLQCLE